MFQVINKKTATSREFNHAIEIVHFAYHLFAMVNLNPALSSKTNIQPSFIEPY